MIGWKRGSDGLWVWISRLFELRRETNNRHLTYYVEHKSEPQIPANPRPNPR